MQGQVVHADDSIETPKASVEILVEDDQKRVYTDHRGMVFAALKTEEERQRQVERASSE